MYMVSVCSCERRGAEESYSPFDDRPQAVEVVKLKEVLWP
jgi:hypothetical protein